MNNTDRACFTQNKEDIWDTIAEVPGEITLTDEQKMELDRRLNAYHQRFS